MRRSILICAILIIGSTLFSADIKNAFRPAFSVSTADDFSALLVNPAGLSVGNAEGAAFITPYDESDFDRSWSILLAGKSMGYSYEHSYGKDYNRLTTSSTMFRNLHVGANWDWTNSFIHDGNWGVSALFRPTDNLSVGSDNQFYEDNDRNTYQLGLGFRPVVVNGKVWDRVTFTGDMSNTNEAGERKWRKPTYGIETELINGLRLSGNYNSETETIGLNFSITGRSARVGTVMCCDEDNNFAHGLLYTHIAMKWFRMPTIPVERNNWVKMKMKPQIVDKPAGTKIGPITLSDGKKEALRDVLNQIKQMKDDPEVNGIYFNVGNVQMSFANACEIRDALLDFKKSGKRIIYYFESIGNLNYALAASTADAIYLNPMGAVELHGFSATMPYLRELLDTLGVEVNNFRSHPYKTAGNMFSEKEMPASEREAMDYILSGFYEEYKNMIVTGRGDRLTQPIDQIIDNGPYTIAEDAYRLGLVDGLYYEDEIPVQMKVNGKMAHIVTVGTHVMQRRDWSDEPATRIALIYASGNIVMGEAQPGKAIGSKTYAEAIRKARQDPSVKGLLLRVDSGGGSALASDIITREIRLCKDQGKPVYVSMGGVAGSGGYYISTYADKIYADPTTITGSIGVIGITFNIEKLLDKIHVNFSTVKKGKHGDMGTIYRAMTSDEKELMSTSIEHTYNVFVDHVAAGRNMNHDAVHAIAQGRVWTGAQAKDRGLVDEIGGLNQALDGMKKQLHAKTLDIVEYPETKGFIVNMDLSMPGMGMDVPPAFKAYTDYLSTWSEYRNEKTLYLMPIILNLPME
jgi:protease-4